MESVRIFFRDHAPHIDVIVTSESSATVDMAAAAHGVEPARIAKTICVDAGGSPILLVMSGTARLDNRKFKDQFKAKPRMMTSDDTVELTSHPIGGVCPFGLPSPLPIYCDISLKAFDTVYPAAGSTNSAVRIDPHEMATLTNATWVDIGQTKAAEG